MHSFGARFILKNCSTYESMNRYSLFNPSQHGFRKNLSCVTQLIEFTHDIAIAIGERFSIDCIYLDFRKVFDTLSYSFLIQKIHTYYINTQVIAWIAEY